MTPEERKEYMREYRLKNKERDKEKIKEQQRVFRLKNKEKLNEKRRLYSIKNNEKCKEYHKEYRQTDKDKKRQIITRWKVRGVICEDFNKMYEIYINTNNCNWCNKDVAKRRYIEHNHNSGEIRGIVCQSCNMKISRKDKKFQKVMSDLISLFIK